MRPADHLNRYSKRYPGAWRQIESFRAMRGDPSLPEWPDWCFCPLHGAHAIVAQAAAYDLSPHPTDVSALAGLAAWRPTQGVYRFDPDLFQAVWDTPVSGRLPVDLLYRLPEWCVYIETPDRTAYDLVLHGFFAYLDWDVNGEYTELILLLDVEGAVTGLFPMPLYIVEAGLQESLDRMLDSARATAFSQGTSLPNPTGEGREQIRREIEPLVSLVLYLCSINSDVRDAAGTTRQPERPTPKRTRKGPRLFPPDHPTVWETGFRIGAALRRAREEGERKAGTGTHASPRPHVRRAHWHTYLTGKGRKKRVLKWLPPIPVGVNSIEDLVPTIRKVD